MTRIDNFNTEDEKAKVFGLIEEAEIIKMDKKGTLVSTISITLPEQLYNDILENKVLKISSDYFRIRRAIDRRIYEIARKHCGSQVEFKISLQLLHQKTGSTATLRRFKQAFKVLVESNDLPDYSIHYDIVSDVVTFTNRDPNCAIKHEAAKQKIEIRKNQKKINSIVQKMVKNSKIDKE